MIFSKTLNIFILFFHFHKITNLCLRFLVILYKIYTMEIFFCYFRI